MLSRTLTRDELLAVHRMLRSHARHVEIARELNLAVSTVGKIARDWKQHIAPDSETGEFDLPEDDPPPDYHARNLRRCPGCGAVVYRWPCLACRIVAAPPVRS